MTNRSAEECEISRSCHSAMFSIAATAWPRITRASPETRSLIDGVPLVRHRRGALLPLGERLLDLADLGAGEVADLGRDRVERRRDTAIAAMSSAWRSRWMIWVEASAGRSPSRPQTISSTRGSTLA